MSKFKLRLSPLREYVYPIMNADGIKITEHVTYGGEESESYPCGFIQDIVYEKKLTKAERYAKNIKTRALTDKSKFSSGDFKLHS